jgi:hypothetical protein
MWIALVTEFKILMLLKSGETCILRLWLTKIIRMQVNNTRVKKDAVFLNSIHMVQGV